MKRKLLFGFACTLAGLSYGQCVIVGPDPVMCVTDAPVSLSIIDHGDIDESGAVYTGPGVSGDVFDPSAAGVGVHTILVEAPGDGYSVDETIPFAPEDISGGGATTVTLGDDNVSGALPIGFDFTFFGETYSDIRIGSNGFLTFSTSTAAGCCSGQNIPNPSFPNNLIAFTWEDLDPGNGGAPAINLVRYQTIGTAPNRIFVVEFFNVDHWSSGNNVFAHTQLYEATNCIEVHIGSQPDAGTHTLGIENEDGTQAYAASGKNGVVWTATNFATQFCPRDSCFGSIDVEVVASPTVNVTSDVEEICFGDEITLTATGTADVYSFGAGIENGVPFVPSITGANVFVVGGTDTDAGCIATNSVSVFVHELPYVDAGPDRVVCEDEEFTPEGISDDPETTFAWDMGATNGVAMMQDPGTVTYTVTGTNAGGCEGTSSMTVESLEAPAGSGVVTMATGAAYDGAIDFTPSGGDGGPYTFLWSNGATTEDISALTTGTYTVLVSDGSCSSEVTFTVDSQAGIEGNELENLNVYPNPFVESFAIEFEGNYAWSVFDNAGKLIANGQASGKEMVSLEGLAAGTYIVKVTADGKESKVSLIKE